MWKETHRQKPSQDASGPSDISAYLTSAQFWFASLYVVIEGWRALGLADARIDQLISTGPVDALRRFRNATFHFQPADLKQQQWFETDHFNWAEELTARFEFWLASEPK